ncbi:MAG: efflux RND transporter periplasmic adaptor subunit [Alphaproteobacteria bacterium]|nr:efflux RND transporter periplasmic adaptor subunit [Alphaproteobacteria bacterium]
MKTIFSAIANWIGGLYEAVMPAFWLRLKPSYQWAGGFLVAVFVWVISGQIAPLIAGHPQAVQKSSGASSDIPRVRVTILDAQPRDATITVRGRTQALHAVDVRAQVEGVVQAIHFDKGQQVKKGDVLCEIVLNDRGAKTAQAQALVDQTGKELQVATELYKDGFRSKTQMAASQANYEQAKAALSTTEVALANTKIRAPFDGFVDERYVDAGDYMRPGDKCELVIAPEPFLAIGAVSEQEVGQLRVGDTASATLVTGESVQGKISFVADRADPATRTFRLEVTLPNPDGKLRDGVSADIHIPVKQLKAVRVSPGILVLDDSGQMGVRAVVGDSVHFFPIQIVEDGPEGMWISGLPEHVRVITVGQQFVNNGERVRQVVDRSGMAT